MGGGALDNCISFVVVEDDEDDEDDGDARDVHKLDLLKHIYAHRYRHKRYTHTVTY